MIIIIIIIIYATYIKRCSKLTTRTLATTCDFFKPRFKLWPEEISGYGVYEWIDRRIYGGNTN